MRKPAPGPILHPRSRRATGVYLQGYDPARMSGIFKGPTHVQANVEYGDAVGEASTLAGSVRVRKFAIGTLRTSAIEKKVFSS